MAHGIIKLAAMVLALALASPSALAAEPAPSLPTGPKEWSHATSRDITAAYQAMVDHHPGLYDPGNPRFRLQLERARAAGLALAPKVTDARGYTAAFRRFGAIMNDGHATAFATIPGEAAKESWPGFITVWRGDGLYVFASKVEGVATGAKVISCDGAKIERLIRRNVFDWFGRAEIEGLWWVRARRVFYDDGNPFVRRPKTCVFEAQGRRTTTTLVWRDGDDDLAAWRVASYNGDTLPIGVSAPRSGLVWIAMPSFQPDQAGVAAYHAMIKSLTDTRADLNAARAIVLDLRANEGGSSQWSRSIAEALWGEARVKRRLDAYFAKVQIWYRADDTTAAHADAIVAQLRTEGFEDTARDFAKTADAIRAAIKAGQPLALAPDDAPPGAAVIDPLADAPGDPPTLKTPVYVIVPGQCASACNDALDAFTRFENVTLVGAPASNDSAYMEVRTEPVPSGMARVVLPTKIWMHRPRGSQDIYRPKVVNRAPTWSTTSFADLIEADLASRSH